MRILRNELYKVYGRRTFVLIILLFLGINAALLYTYSPDPMVEAESYRMAYAHIEGLPESERAEYIRNSYKAMEWIAFFMDSSVDKAGLPEEHARYYDLYESGEYMQFTQDAHREYFLFRELNSQLEQVENYAGYLRDIQERAENTSEISIFSSSDPFSLRNAQRTSQAFKQLEGNTLYFTNSHTLVSATDFAATDFLLIALLFYVVVTLVVYEKEKGLFTLAKPLALGRWHFLSAKTGVLFLSAILFTMLFWGGNLLIATVKYGAINMGAYLQSISGYAGSALNVTILEYLIIFFLSKILIYFAIGLLFLYFALISKSVVMLYVRSVVLLALSFVLYLFVDGNSPLQVLKYANIINFVQVTPVYRYYFNLNIFSWPVNIVTVFVLCSTLLCAIFYCLNLYVYVNRDSVIALKSRYFLRRKRPERCYTSLVRHEAYKLLIVQKALWVLCLFACLQTYLLFQDSPYMNIDERHYKSYMEVLGGEVTDNTRIIIEREQERLASFARMMDDAQQSYAENNISLQELNSIQKLVADNTKGQSAFSRVLDQFAYAQEQENPWMVYETGYEKLTGNSFEGYNDDLKNAVILLVVMIAAFSALFSTEFSSGMVHIISCYKLGQANTVKAKLGVSIPLFTALFLVAYIPDFIAILNQYSLPYATASLSSISSLAGFPIDMKLWQYLTLLYAYRYVVFLCILLTIFMLSVYAKNTIATISVSSVVFVLPAFMHMIGLRWADYFSLNAFISGNILLNNWYGVLSVLLMLLPLALGAFAFVRLIHAFSVSMVKVRTWRIQNPLRRIEGVLDK